MRTRLVAAVVILLSFQGRAFAHRLDEYLQATTLSLERNRVVGEMVLTPGVAVFGQAMALIDTDRDGVIAGGEEEAYVKRVIRDVSISADGEGRELRLTSVSFPLLSEMREGLGRIRIEFAADLPGDGPVHKLVLVNKHQASISAYLVNVLMPTDAGIRITGQDRNYDQSRYDLDFSRDNAHPARAPSWWAGALLGSGMLSLLYRRRASG